MPDPRIDAYIEAAPAFARPIMDALRAAVHRACPGAEETMRWSMPSFSYRGRILANMAAFKGHASFGFGRGEAAGEAAKPGAMGHLGRLTELADLPPEAELDAMIARAAALIESGPPPRAPAPAARPDIPTPADLIAALDAAARARFDAFPPGKRREYAEWIEAAKRPETRAKRLAQAVEQIADGKALHWKYERR